MFFFRSLLKAFGVALVSSWVMFFLGVFLSLVVMLIISAVTSSHPNMSLSYRVVGLTAACTGFVLGFGGSLAYDLRRLSSTTSR